MLACKPRNADGYLTYFTTLNVHNIVNKNNTQHLNFNSYIIKTSIWLNICKEGNILLLYNTFSSCSYTSFQDSLVVILPKPTQICK